MRLKARVRSGFVLVGVLGAAAIAVDAGSIAVGSPHAARAKADACPSVAARNPYAVAQRFITAAVERKDLKASYALATPQLRHGVSCRQWLRGHVPVPQVQNIDWKRSGYRPVAGDSQQLVLRIFLAQPNAVLPGSFLMELRHQDGGWHVRSFHKDETAPTPALAA